MAVKPALFIFVLLAALIGGGWFYTNQLGAPRKVATSSVSIADSQSILAPTGAPTIIATKTSNVHSPDGKKDLIMQRQIKSNDSIAYFFYTADVNREDKKLIFTKTLGANNLFILPNNAWSPDNKYFFIKENSAGMLTAYVFNAAGEAFSDGSEYIDVGPKFVSKNNGNVLTDITGWDSETLLHIFSSASDGISGPSYWFEIPSTAVIQLATK